MRRDVIMIKCLLIVGGILLATIVLGLVVLAKAMNTAGQYLEDLNG